MRTIWRNRILPEVWVVAYGWMAVESAYLDPVRSRTALVRPLVISTVSSQNVFGYSPRVPESCLVTKSWKAYGSVLYNWTRGGEKLTLVKNNPPILSEFINISQRVNCLFAYISNVYGGCIFRFPFAICKARFVLGALQRTAKTIRLSFSVVNGRTPSQTLGYWSSRACRILACFLFSGAGVDACVHGLLATALVDTGSAMNVLRDFIIVTTYTCKLLVNSH